MSVDVDALKAAQAKGLTVGVIPKSGQPALRLEIDDFIQDEKLANLYFLALEAFMQNDIYKQPFSYYEISGIHGQPYRAWDNVTSANFTPTGFPTSRDSGYCAHGSVLFPVWHRAYLAQFEQALFLHAADIAPKLLGNSAQSVLDRFRIPFWDPLLPRQKLINAETYKYGIPIIFTLPKIQVRRPEDPSTLVPMDNPLYRFDFPQKDVQSIDWTEGFGNDYNKVVSQNTIRGYDGSAPSANHSFVMATFDNNYNPNVNLGSPDPGSLWRVMLDNQNWMTMSNHFDSTNRRASNYTLNSLEGFHDDIHGYLGSGPNSGNGDSPSGHMAMPQYAGFDPVFWLHHCNIDRLLAIWQGIHSKDADSVSWWVSELHVAGTIVEPANEKETPKTPLAPFRRALDSQSKPIWWKSLDLREYRNLGYDYPQTAAARQTGDLVAGLTSWANAELGWATPPGSGAPGQPDQQDRVNLKHQFTQRIPAFPESILVDGTTPLYQDEEYISSSAPVVVAEAATMAEPPQVALATVSSTNAVAKNAPKSALSTYKLDFNARFGGFDNLVSQGRMTQWNASFGVEKYALNGSFIVYFFMGDFNDNPGVWLHDPHLAGSSSIFASPRTTIDSQACANCANKEASGLKYYDTVGLTQALLMYWKSGEPVNELKVTSLEPEVVVPFLTENLHWRVVDVRGAHIPRETIPSLKVGVYSESVLLPRELKDKPLFENQNMHTEVTDGRPGGLNQGESL